MKQIKPFSQQILRSQLIIAAAVFGLIVFPSLACRLSDYLPGNNSSNANQSSQTARPSEPSAAKTEVANGFCQNAYYPIGADVERRYRIVYQGNSLSPKEYTQSYTDIGADKFTEHNKFADVQNALNFKCTAEGLQGLQYDAGNTVSTNNNVRGKLETTKAEGVTLPAEARLRVGEKWTGNYEGRWNMQTGSNNNITSNATVENKSEVVGEESVTVPAGTFQCLKVRSTTVFRFAAMKIGNITAPAIPPITINTDSYYAKNTGLVKSVTTGTIGATTELLSSNAH